MRFRRRDSLSEDESDVVVLWSSDGESSSESDPHKSTMILRRFWRTSWSEVNAYVVNATTPTHMTKQFGETVAGSKYGK